MSGESRMGIRAKLILSTCIPLLLIYAAVLAWDYWNSRRQATQQIEQLVAQRASAEASQVNGRLMAAQNGADRVAYALATGLGEAGRPNASDAAAGADAAPPGPPPPPPPPRPTTRPYRPRAGDPGGPPPAPPGPPPAPGLPLETTRPSGPREGVRGEPPRGPGDRGFNRTMIELLAQTPWVNAVWYRFDADAHRGRRPLTAGFHRTSGDGPPVQPFTPSPTRLARWFDVPMRDGKAVWLEPGEVNEPALGPACVFVAPFYASQDATPSGVVCVSIPVAALRFIREDTPVQLQLRELLAGPADRPTSRGVEPAGMDRGGYLLLGRNGHVLSRPDDGNRGGVLTIGPDQQALREAVDGTLRGSGRIVLARGLSAALGRGTDDGMYVLAFEPLMTTGWAFVTATSEAELLGPVQERLVKRGLLLAGSLAVLVAVLTWTLTRFCRPIEQMAGTVRQLASGDLDTPAIPVTRRDEVGQLAAGFNDMTGRLKHHVAELTKQSAEREKVEGELRIARQIQRDLLPGAFPPFPHRDEFDLHAVNMPARHVAGDFFDYFFVGDDSLTVVIADVSGKGVPSALVMAVTRTMVRDLAQMGLCPRQIVERVNGMLLNDTKPGLFVTMVLGQYEPSSGRLTYVNAGHPPLVRFGANEPARTCCGPTGPLLGVDADGDLGPFEQTHIVLRPGEGVLLYTDGVTEAHDETNVLFGETRLVSEVAANAERATPDLCERLVSVVMAYQHQSVTDDLTLVCLRHVAR